MLVVVRQERDDRPPAPFSPAELAQLRVLADFAARAAQNARLYARLGRLKDEAERRERERARLSNQLAEAEQAERRRLALLLHDGPQQTITSAALLLDACTAALDDDDTGEVHRILGIARQRNREAVRDLRELGWSLEPPALREQGITAALLPLAERLGEAHGVRFSLDLEAAEALDTAQQTFVYQIVREAVANAVKHAQPETIAILSTVLPGRPHRDARLRRRPRHAARARAGRHEPGHRRDARAHGRARRHDRVAVARGRRHRRPPARPVAGRRRRAPRRVAPSSGAHALTSAMSGSLPHTESDTFLRSETGSARRGTGRA